MREISTHTREFHAFSKKLSAAGSDCAGASFLSHPPRPRLRIDFPAGMAKTLRLYGRTERKFADGKNRLAVQASRLHFSVLRDLRRYQWLLGLRPARRRA